MKTFLADNSITNRTIFRGILLGAACVLLLTACSREVIEDGDNDAATVAELLNTRFYLDENETIKYYWLPVDVPLVLFHQSDPGISVEILNSDGQRRAEGLLEFFDVTPPPGITGIAFGEATGLHFIKVSRNNPETEGIIILETGLAVGALTEDNFLDILDVSDRIVSPLLLFPFGIPVFQLPENSGFDNFTDYVLSEFSFVIDEGIEFFEYLLEEELLLAECLLPPAGAPPSTSNFPSSAPSGAAHDDNFCGMSAFINSMMQNFPGALDPNVKTDKDAWDEMGDNLDHSNTFGIRGGKFLDRVNFKYGWESKAKDGKRYCAIELKDPTAMQLATCSQDCNIKILLYDLPSFGHWVDIVSVSGTTLNIQDYGNNYNVKYIEADENIDFTGASGGPAADNFDSSDSIAGDGFGEIVDFYAVCECQRQGAVNLRIPSKNITFEQRTRRPQPPARRN